MTTKNNTNKSVRRCRNNSHNNSERQAKSEDRIGDLLDLIVRDLQTKEASHGDREAAGQALLELVRIKASQRVGGRLANQRDDISGDVILGTSVALERLRKLLAGGPPGGSPVKFAMAAKTPSFPASHAARKRYVMGIVNLQFQSAIRKACRYASRQMDDAWVKEGEDEPKLIHSELAATTDYLERLRQHGPTPDEVRTVIANAAFQGRFIAAALYDLTLKVYEGRGEPAPKFRKAPASMRPRTRQGYEKKTKDKMAAQLRKMMREDLGEGPAM